VSIQFWFEFASTYWYPAAMRVERIAKAAGIQVSWHPFLLGPIFRAQGWNDSLFNIYPIKGRYMWRDVERICVAEGLAFTKPTTFPRNGLFAARVCAHFGKEAWLPAFVREIYTANFARDQDIADPGVVAGCLQTVGIEPEAVLVAAGSDAAKNALRSQTEQAMKLGVFGAPSFVVGDELFWGNDRLEQALGWARRAHQT
jgi:2-hydroxychromene-2-carboxylate isomerase